MKKLYMYIMLASLVAGTNNTHSYAMAWFTHNATTSQATAEAASEKQPVTINNYYTTKTDNNTKQHVRTAVKFIGGAALLALGLRYGKCARIYIKDVVKVPTRVRQIQDRVISIEKNMATKAQCETIRTQITELKKMVATKQDLASLATKKDISPLATQEQVAALADILEKMLPA